MAAISGLKSKSVSLENVKKRKHNMCVYSHNYSFTHMTEQMFKLKTDVLYFGYVI